MELVGKKFKSTGCNEYTVIRQLEERARNRTIQYEVEFDEVNGVKYRTIRQKCDILSGRIRNPFYPTVCGIGYIGNAMINDNLKIYNRWTHMIQRCYNKNNRFYSTYGGSGVYVCEKWLSFENFLDDFCKIEGYKEEELDSLTLDKDIKAKGNISVYSLETCILVSPQENIREMNLRARQKIFMAVSPNGETYEHNNQKEFAIIHGLQFQNISNVLNKKRETHRGWKFYYKENC